MELRTAAAGTAAAVGGRIRHGALLLGLSPLRLGRTGRSGRLGRSAGPGLQRFSRGPPGGKDRPGGPRGLAPPCAPTMSRPTAVERLQALAEKIIQRWGDRAEADDARGILLDLALGEGRLEKAEQYLQADFRCLAAPRRGRVEPRPGAVAAGTTTFAIVHPGARPHGGSREDDRPRGRLAWRRHRAMPQGDRQRRAQRPRREPRIAPRGHARPGPDPHDGGPARRGDRLAGRPEHRCRGIPAAWPCWPTSRPASWTKPRSACRRFKPRFRLPAMPMLRGKRFRLACVSIVS